MSTEGSFSDVGQKAQARPQVALIAGPTASGKSDLAVRLALALREQGREAVVINADSAQVYADLAVLSARPSEAETAGIPHRLFGEWDGARACSAADWAAAARAQLLQLRTDRDVAILVGGTGLYLKALLEGIAPIPSIDAEVRERVRALPVTEAHAQLQRLDPERAALLNPADTTRVARALEVVLSTGKPLAHWQARKEGGVGGEIELHPLVLLPDRQWLYERCDQRFDLMLESGAIGEVEALLARGLDPDLPVMRAIGVREIAGYLRGEWPLEEARNRGAQATRNYVKRQVTWLRHQCPPEWLRLESYPYDWKSPFEVLLRQ